MKQAIIKNMREYHAGKWVSPGIAVYNVSGDNVFRALDELVKDGIVERTLIGGMPFVRYTPQTPTLKVIQ